MTAYLLILDCDIFSEVASLTVPFHCPPFANQPQESDQPILISLLCQEKIIHVHPT